MSLPKIDLDESKTATPDEKSHGLGTPQESRNNKKNGAYFRRFRVKELRHSETISDENCYLCRSTRP